MSLGGLSRFGGTTEQHEAWDWRRFGSGVQCRIWRCMEDWEVLLHVRIGRCMRIGDCRTCGRFGLCWELLV